MVPTLFYCIFPQGNPETYKHSMRYIGSKTKLLSAIQELLEDKGLAQPGLTFCDIFSGTSTVGDYFKNTYRILANDSLFAAYALSRGKLCRPCTFDNLGRDPFEYFNNVDTDGYIQGFCYNNFAPTISGRMYFSDDNAKRIDFIRDTIDRWYAERRISEDEKHYLIACLLESLSKVSNVAGVYSAFLRKWDPRAVKQMQFIPVEQLNDEPAYDNVCHWGNANDYIKEVQGDILYLDPPYTPTQYVSQYHVLETIARNDNPATHGVGAHRDNGDQISNWCKAEYVGYEFERLIAEANFEHILFSYSDAGIMSKEFIERVMKRYAIEGTYEFRQIDFVKYRSTRSVNREIEDHKQGMIHYEWLFYIQKKRIPIYISPLNYIGGKYEIIPLIQDNTPKDIHTFYDLFGGGATVSINAQCDDIVYNDINFIVKDLLLKIKENDIGVTIRYINKAIKKYGLAKENKEAYYALRNDYNAKPIVSRNPLDLYLLICYGFEHQIRFNSKMEFNNPCGNSGFNQEMLEKLISFHYIANKRNVAFASGHYREFEADIHAYDFVYCDPPYLNSCGAYNDGKRGFNGWDEIQEKELLDFLLRLHNRGIRFMLSNMVDRNGNTNDSLNEWIKTNNFYVIRNQRLTKRNRQDRVEILITNYQL